MSKKVAVLLSSYNGELYVKEQIDSILAQTYDNIDIYVRDDGSSDGTVEILKEYREKGLIKLCVGKNRGFVRSFESLIVNAGEADYYAFCDQDDVWLPEKIEMAVEILENANPEKPTLYFSNYDFVDADLNLISHRDIDETKMNISFLNSMVDCPTLGFNSIFNRAARESFITHRPTNSTGHDWWMYMICAGLGEVVYDNRVTVKYRRTGNNVSDGGANWFKFQIWRFKRFFLNGYFKKIHIQIKDFRRLYREELCDRDKKQIDMLAADGFNPINTVKKVCYLIPYRQKLVDELFLRLIFLIGRM